MTTNFFFNHVTAIWSDTFTWYAYMIQIRLCYLFQSMNDPGINLSLLFILFLAIWVKYSINTQETQ